eukprot:TRINITY_DN7684_c0_g1_i5.p1 TRINITY_DN7684_c0_g1~~TRINITY_DN7684_c0_g1_i5.p1  ORF type:complete len:244 (-),score=37.50 TRINITY_DN7684_c0_g1_i5:93-824(-)
MCIRDRVLPPSKLGHEIFAKVDEEFILDDFNLKGLSSYIPNLRHAIYYILNYEVSDSEDDPAENEQDIAGAGKYAEMAYGLVHARYIQTPKGMKQMMMRYQKGVFGTCPRVYCEHQPLLPYGQLEVPGNSPVRFYCPRCQDLYAAQKSRHEDIDGAFFGPNFAHMFVVNYPLLSIKPKQNFAGTICGFKMHESSNNHPQKIVFDSATGSMKNLPRPKVEFADPLTVMKSTRKFITDIKPIPGE